MDRATEATRQALTEEPRGMQEALVVSKALWLRATDSAVALFQDIATSTPLPWTQRRVER